jgi:hypothetical protein
MKRAAVRSAMLLRSKLSEGDAMLGPSSPAVAFRLFSHKLDRPLDDTAAEVGRRPERADTNVPFLNVVRVRLIVP